MKLAKQRAQAVEEYKQELEKQRVAISGLEDIEVEGDVQAPFSISVKTNPWGGSATGTIRDVVFRNVAFTGSGKASSVLRGHGPAAGPGGMSNFSFVNLSISGTHVANAAEGHFIIDAKTVANVSFT